MTAYMIYMLILTQPSPSLSMAHKLSTIFVVLNLMLSFRSPGLSFELTSMRLQYIGFFPRQVNGTYADPFLAM